LAFVSCSVRVIGPEGEALFETTRPAAADETTQQLTEGTAGPYHGSVMFRADAYQRAGGYRAAFRYAQDWDLWLRLADEGLLAYIPAFLYAFRVGDHSVSATRREQQLRLAALAHRCRGARLCASPEAPHLQAAWEVSVAPPRPAGTPGSAGNSYFIGKCLLDRRDARAVGYLRQSVRQCPWQVRGWVALVAAAVRCRRSRTLI
jgi:hypothetical protein